MRCFRHTTLFNEYSLIESDIIYLIDISSLNIFYWEELI